MTGAIACDGEFREGDETREIEITFTEDDRHTEARASLTIRGATFVGVGRARRHPADPSTPMVGEELAAARALSDLSHRLLDTVTETISESEGRPAH
jgi:hypothetical protein